MTRHRLVVIGNGMAGARFVDDLLARDGADRFDVTVFGDEPHGNYNRILLSSVLAGHHSPADILINPLSWYAARDVTLHAGVRVDEIDLGARRMRGADGTIAVHEQYQVSRVGAGDFTTIVVIARSLLRPVGGWLSDRIGGYRLLLLLLVGVGGCLLAVAIIPPLPVVVGVLFCAMGLLGMGNGAVFQLVPQRFADRIGIVTGVVGAAGGLGGFCLPSLLGAAKDATGSYAPGLVVIAIACMGGAVALLRLGSQWSARWHQDAVKQSGIFCYRGVVRRLLGAETA